jgi:8-oxo-dGTP diphosphatase
MEKIQQRVACKALIRHGSKVLFLREAATYKDGTNIGKYHLPGGRIDPGEPFLEGLAREVLEETGLKVAVGTVFYVSEWFPVIRGQKNHIVGMFFSCTAKTDKVRLSDEHDDAVWIDPKDFKKLNLMSPEDKVLETYLQSLL